MFRFAARRSFIARQHLAQTRWRDKVQTKMRATCHAAAVASAHWRDRPSAPQLPRVNRASRNRLTTRSHHGAITFSQASREDSASQRARLREFAGVSGLFFFTRLF